jgi:hypothetical protein
MFCSLITRNKLPDFDKKNLLKVLAQVCRRSRQSVTFFYFFGWDETESIWYIGHYFAYCTSPG